MQVPNPHNEGYRVTAFNKTSSKITLWVTRATPTSVPDTQPVGTIVCKKDNTQPNRSGVESPEDVTALIYLNTSTFNSATLTMGVGTLVDYQSNKYGGIENLSLFGWT